ALTVQDCVIRNFAYTGQAAIFFGPNASSTLAVYDTVISDNGSDGIYVQPYGTGTVIGIIDRVRVENGGLNGNGFEISPGFTTGGSITMTISNSVFANNTRSGVVAGSSAGQAPVSLMVRNSTMVNNGIGGGYFGIGSLGSTSTVLVTRCTIT